MTGSAAAMNKKRKKIRVSKGKLVMKDYGATVSDFHGSLCVIVIW